MARLVTMHEAKSQLSRLVQQALAGEDVVIGRAGTPLVRLVPVQAVERRQPGSARGRVVVAPTFDDPLPDESRWTAPLDS
ncbi:MAG: type II toxin-antitoxin system prevent-host-death family antitoxin [Actinomycetia bacterium]|nr:type II toxin-antitoxin system prevent-host-death family antitoxin [Actinomycetes bacterium]